MGEIPALLYCMGIRVLVLSLLAITIFANDQRNAVLSCLETAVEPHQLPAGTLTAGQGIAVSSAFSGRPITLASGVGAEP